MLNFGFWEPVLLLLTLHWPGRLQIQSWVHVYVSLVGNFKGVWGHQWCCCRFDEQDWQTTDTILSTCMCFTCRQFYGCLRASVVLLQVWWAAQVAGRLKMQSWVHVCVSLAGDFVGVWGHHWCCCRFNEQDWQTTDTILSTCMCFTCRRFCGCLRASLVLLQV